MKKKNILLILVDEERFPLPPIPEEELPGHHWVASRGVTYNRYHVNAAPCGPSRSVIFTGQHTAINGMIDNLSMPYINDLSPEIPTLGSMIADQGYYCAYKGKWHLSTLDCISDNPSSELNETHTTERDMEPYGFKDYQLSGEINGHTLEGHLTDDEISSWAKRWLKHWRHEPAESKPFFLTVGLVNPHDIMFHDIAGLSASNPSLSVAPQPDTPFYAKNWNPQMPQSFYKDFNQDRFEDKPMAHREWDRIVRAQFGGLDNDQETGWRAHLNYYYNQIRDVDRCIHSVLQTLDELGLTEETIVILSADHGDMTGAHGLRQKGPMIYAENNRVPLMIAHPEGPANIASNSLFCALDLAPTLISIAGGSPNAYPQLKGIDLSNTLKSPNISTQRDEHGVLFTYAAFNSVDADFIIAMMNLDPGSKPDPDTCRDLKPDLNKRGHLRGILWKNYKFARYFAPVNYQMPTDFQSLLASNDLELYDLSKDPDEIHNLALDPEAHRDLIMELNQKLNWLITEEIGEDAGPPIPKPHHILPQDS